MSEKTTYEIIIAEKLGHLTVPDMREAIWSRISDQLDMDMPDGDEPPKPDTPDTPRWISFTKRFGIFAAIVAAVAILLINQKQTPPGNNNKQVVPAVIQPAAIPGANAESPPPGNTYPQNNTAISPVTNDAPIVVGDSVMHIPVSISPVTRDTVSPKNNAPPNILQANVPVKQDTIPRKKSKGFKGITDDDYRISLKKDSLP